MFEVCWALCTFSPTQNCFWSRWPNEIFLLVSELLDEKKWHTPRWKTDTASGNVHRGLRMMVFILVSLCEVCWALCTFSLTQNCFRFKWPNENSLLVSELLGEKKWHTPSWKTDTHSGNVHKSLRIIGFHFGVIVWGVLSSVYLFSDSELSSIQRN